MRQDNASSRSEYLKFGILVVILGLVLFLVALSRPFLFGRLVPAVLGESLTTAPMAGAKPPLLLLEAAPESAARDLEEETEPGAALSEPDQAPTAPPLRRHTVQPGQTVTSIARLYGTTIEEIVSLNNLADPNRIRSGDQLLIPAR